jgi:hypothetical protein
MAAINYQFESIPDLEPARNATPTAILVLGSYPNPFNSEITLDYEILKPGKVSLQVLNLLGQTVEKRSLGYQEVGRYSVQWNHAFASSSGLYFYCLSHPETTRWGRWVYIK